MIEKNMETGLEVAVLGMACRFPGAKDIDTFWDNLKNGMESITFLSEKELEKEGVPSSLLQDPNYIKSLGGVLEDIEYFDAFFFDYTPMEVEQMAPPTRIFHECLWHTLEDAGYDPGTFNRLIGLYTGVSSTYNWKRLSDFSSANINIDSLVSNY